MKRKGEGGGGKSGVCYCVAFDFLSHIQKVAT